MNITDNLNIINLPFTEYMFGEASRVNVKLMAVSACLIVYR